ncbi:MAG: primosomal protein N' [Candidatus Limnocylindrales bacterium]
MFEPSSVEVAVDAMGAAGGRTYTYTVPDRFAGLAAGEAVIVEFGRRQALGIVLGPVAAPDGVTLDLKPILERVRSEGPLLPPLQLALARVIAHHYLAPAAMVVRAALPPGTLERLEYVARVAASGADGAAVGLGQRTTTVTKPNAVDVELLARVAEAGPAGIAVARLTGARDRAATIRRLRALGAAGAIDLAWELRPPSVHRRYIRLVRLTDEGRAARGQERPAGRRPLGPRQRAVIAMLADDPRQAVPAPEISARFGGGAVTSLAARGLIELEATVADRLPYAERDRHAPAMPAGAALNADQALATAAIIRAVEARSASAFLLDGVTAAGKTAVYVAAVTAARRLGRGALLLVPEVALATPLLDRLRTETSEDVAILHAGLSEGERADEWRRIREHGVGVVVGTRTALLAPIADLGVIVVDEEHDAAYKSDRTPRLQARDMAVELGRLASAPVVLSSATPDVATMGSVAEGRIERLTLREQAVGRAPVVDVVDLRQELAGGNRSLLSAALASALANLDRDAGDRAILVLDRRGTASVVLCRDCGYVQVCPECQRPLVFHAAGMALRCHHCGATAPPATRCPACASARIRYLGGGTERLEREVGDRFPNLRVGRLDRDVLERKGAADRVLDAFADGALDVLVGTRLVTKGLDIAAVALVSIVSADIALNLPDERSAERTYQLLRQAIGRAGRGARPGRAIIQTYVPDHPAIRAVADGDSETFYRDELAARRRFGAPPFGRYIKLTVALEDRAAAEAAGRTMAGNLRNLAQEAGSDTVVLGPVPAYIARRGGRWRFHLVLRGTDPSAVLRADPGPPWSVDVDPESLL